MNDDSKIQAAVLKARQINAGKRKEDRYLKDALKGLEGVDPVVVVDVNMRFASMVMFMIKWALASIPAFAILFIIGWVLVRVLGGFLILSN